MNVFRWEESSLAMKRNSRVAKKTCEYVSFVTFYPFRISNRESERKRVIRMRG